MRSERGRAGVPKSDPRRIIPATDPLNGRLPADAFGLGTLLLLTVIVAWEHLGGGGWALLQVDALLFFTPMWGFLGEQLRAGNIPGWNPSQFGGAPFAGDPESGWMYLPVMLFATLLPPVGAFKAVVVFHLALAGFTTYALGRVLGLGVLAGLVAGTAYEFGALLEYTRCCTPFAQIGAWLPLALLGVELAARASAWLPRVAWWGVAGLAISQMLAGWLGQGAYYGLLMVGGFLAYRTVLVPPEDQLNLWSRLAAMLTHGAAVLTVGFGLGAAGLLPRLAAIERSTLAGGSYGQLMGDVTGPTWWTLPQALDYLLSIAAADQRYYAGGATLALALLAPLLAGRRFAVPFFGVAALIALTLTLNPTPLHALFALLPRFQVLHEHYPERALIVFYLPLALLAGATIAALPRWRRTVPFLLAGLLPAFALVLATPRLERVGLSQIATPTVWAVGLVALLLTVSALVRLPRPRAVLPVLLLIVVFADPTGWQLISQRALHGQLRGESAALYDTYYSSGGAARFLLARQTDPHHGPARYAGYDLVSMEPFSSAYFRTYRLPLVPALLLNNRATALGLHDLSGYNPVQPARYRAIIDALNRGQVQDYHQTNLLPAGLESPLLDLLNVRYIVVPFAVSADRGDLQLLTRRYPTVYEDGVVRVLENTDALPRAWLVHEAAEASPGEALAMLAGGVVDPRRTTLLETAPPALAAPRDPAADGVAVTAYTPDRILLSARSDAPGLLVISDTYDPDWRAYVDGEPAPVLVANYVLRAVALPAGAHTVELRYEPRSLTVGLVISAATLGVLAAALAILAVGRWRSTTLPSVAQAPVIRRPRRLSRPRSARTPRPTATRSRIGR
ncbi:MAG: YfhO family protein [Chloroflexota bacterium]|nr:YfhO family protein [Chloroflexota bacterium]